MAGGNFYSKRRSMSSYKRGRSAPLRRYARAVNSRTGGFVGVEQKWTDNGYSGAIVNTVTGAEADPSTYDCLNGVSQGDGPNNRIGRRYTVKMLTLNGRITFSPVADGADVAQPPTIRVSLVWDKQTNNAQFNSEDVYDASADPGFTNAPSADMALRNLEYTTRFQVLWTKVFTARVLAAATDGTNTNSTSFAPIIFTINKRLNVGVQCNGTTEAVSAIVDNSLHMMAMSSTTVGTPTLKYFYRVRFVDP